jgi:hypothetical protein
MACPRVPRYSRALITDGVKYGCSVATRPPTRSRTSPSASSRSSMVSTPSAEDNLGGGDGARAHHPHAATIDAARATADQVLNTFSRDYPAAMACLADDLDALLAIHRVPRRHRITVRTTNLAERSFVEERRRTKVVPRLGDERSATKLVFATLIRCADRWHACRSATSNATSCNCCVPSSASTHRQPETPPTRSRRRRRHEAHATPPFTGRSGLDPCVSLGTCSRRTIPIRCMSASSAKALAASAISSERAASRRKSGTSPAARTR